jgi:hypothetical protein
MPSWMVATLCHVRARTLTLVVAMALVAGLSSANAAPERRPRVTIIGDSVAASILYTAQAQRYLQHRYDLKLDLAVCRRLVAASCAYQGHTPTTALEAIRERRGHLGRTVAIDVGYSDAASTYKAGLDRVMRALVSEGVRTVVWTTFKETSTSYRLMNGVIRHAKRRWKQLRVADWNAWSAGRPWFAGDGLHLNGAGAIGLAHLLARSIGGGR